MSKSLQMHFGTNYFPGLYTKLEGIFACTWLFIQCPAFPRSLRQSANLTFKTKLTRESMEQIKKAGYKEEALKAQ